MLEKILTEHPEIEVVQIQLNYLDYDDPSIESGNVYRVCRKFHKPILVMEPVKGGALAALPGAGPGNSGPAEKRQSGQLRHPLCGGLFQG